jgi:hypothetical protein
MHIAAIKGEHKIIKLLLLFNANPFIYTYKNLYSPLDYARESKKVEVLKILQPIFDQERSKANGDFNNLYEKKVKKIIINFIINIK